MDAFETCCSILPADLSQVLRQYSEAEELRLRCGYRPSIITCGKEMEICNFEVTENFILRILEIVTGASIHSAADSLSNGYLSYRGLRIGVCGQAIYSKGNMLGFRKYKSLSVRIPHQINAIPDEISCGIYKNMRNTLIIAAPGAGKTTALRELVNIISNQGMRVALADERGELSSSVKESSLGPCTDIISNMPKAKAALMMLRSMNPQVIAMDEISSCEDICAVRDITGFGVSILATAHGISLEDMAHRPIYRDMLEDGLFKRFLIISIKNGKREYRLERTD